MSARQVRVADIRSGRRRTLTEQDCLESIESGVCQYLGHDSCFYCFDVVLIRLSPPIIDRRHIVHPEELVSISLAIHSIAAHVDTLVQPSSDHQLRIRPVIPDSADAPLHSVFLFDSRVLSSVTFQKNQVRRLAMVAAPTFKQTYSTASRVAMNIPVYHVQMELARVLPAPTDVHVAVM